MMTSQQIRQAYIDFFVERHRHTFVKSSPVVPHDDPTLLFTNAGMNQFKPYFLGTESAPWPRVANTQKCIRAGGKHNDLDDVGRSRRHHTFFEMLGNWSFGDYFKQGAIEMAWELLTKVWGLDPSRLHVTVHAGDEAAGIPRDEEAANIWRAVAGLPNDRIHYGPTKDNFWEMGETGPCGPCTEIFIDRTPDKTGGPTVLDGSDPRVMEIWNNVFIQYNRNPDRTLTKLPAQHVDTGMGFERICTVLQNVNSNYEIDLFNPFWAKLKELSGHTYGGKYPKSNEADPVAEAADPQLRSDIAFRVIADHVRCLTFAITDGGVPSNEGRGYVLRRILRRAVRFGRQQLGLRDPFLHALVPIVVDTMGSAFPELGERPLRVAETIRDEELSFGRTLGRGIELFEQAAARAGGPSSLGLKGKPEPVKAGSNRAVVFDTNAYRDFLRKVMPAGKWNVKTLRLAESAQSHLTLANPFVIMELAAHLADSADPAYQECRDALTLLAEHCRVGDKQRLFLIADSESLVARSLFDVTLAEHAKTTENLSVLALVIANTDRNTELLPQVTARCEDIRQYVEKIEQQFISDMQSHVVKQMNPTCAGWVPFVQGDPRQQQVLDVVRSEMMLDVIASGFVVKAAEQAGRSKDADQIRKMSWELRNQAEPSIRLYREILQRLAQSGCDVSRPERANWIWDMQIAMAIGADVGGPFGHAESLMLVTGDSAIVDAADAAGLSANVQSLSKYLDLLESGAEPVAIATTSGTAVISATDAFKLHDTYGFPIDLTRIMAEERGMSVDIAGYERLMEGAKERARAGGKEASTRLFELPPDVLANLQEQGVKPTDDSEKFNAQPIGARVMAIWDGHRLIDATHGAEAAGQGVAVILDKTNFYAEMGGQVGDTGELRSAGGAVMAVKTTRAAGGFVLHVGDMVESHLSVGDHVTATLEGVRPRTEKNHTATHIANWALREVLGETVQQKGSLVDPDKLRFDFSHTKALADDEIARVETLVNERIAQKLPVYAENAPQEQALKISGLRAVFGEKYPPMVRVVSIGVRVADLLSDPANAKWRGYSVEFCGGTHLKNAGDCEGFVVTSEESVSKGIRRITALTGPAASAASKTAASIDAEISKARAVPEAQLGQTIATLQKTLGGDNVPLRAKRRGQAAITELQSKQKAWEKSQKQSTGATIDVAAVASKILAEAETLGPGKLLVGEIADASDEQLRGAMDSLRKKSPSHGILLGSAVDAKVTFVAAVSDDLIAAGLKAGDWIRETAKVAGGGGGGKPQMAQAGGKDPSKLLDALAKAREYARGVVK